MKEIRKMFLYRYDHNGRGQLVETRTYAFTTLANERQLADDFAEELEKVNAGMVINQSEMNSLGETISDVLSDEKSSSRLR